jgi:hypothetical protein
VKEKRRTKRISIDVPIDLHIALKMYTAKNNMPIKMFVLRVIIEELSKNGAIKIK